MAATPAQTKIKTKTSKEPRLLELPGLVELNREIAACTRCTRLVEYCQKIGRIKRRAYLGWDYWAKPVPGFGDPEARARTGRGDTGTSFLDP